MEGGRGGKVGLQRGKFIQKCRRSVMMMYDMYVFLMPFVMFKMTFFLDTSHIPQCVSQICDMMMYVDRAKASFAIYLFYCTYITTRVAGFFFGVCMYKIDLYIQLSYPIF